MKLSIAEQISIAHSLLTESVLGKDKTLASLQNLTIMSLMSLIEIAATSTYKPRAIDFRAAGIHNRNQVWVNAIRNLINEVEIHRPELEVHTTRDHLRKHYDLGKSIESCFDLTTAYGKELDKIRIHKGILPNQAVCIYHDLILKDGMVLAYKLKAVQPPYCTDAELTEYMYQNFNKAEK